MKVWYDDDDDGMILREMESALALADGNAELVAENSDGAVVGHLEIVDACHD